MSGFFSLAPGEMTNGAIYYLGSIFGAVGNTLAGSGPQLLPNMFRIFNTIVLSIGTIIISYTTFMGILLTAHEGKVLGSKLHGIWVPLRTVFGLSALIPTATGYSYLQVGLMWFVIQGIGAADTLWTTTADYINAGGTTVPLQPGSEGSGSAANTTVRSSMNDLFRGLVCQAAMKRSNSDYYCANNTEKSFCKASDSQILNISDSTLQTDASFYSMGDGGKCGKLSLLSPTIDGDDALKTKQTVISDAKKNAYQLIVPTLGAIARQLVDEDYKYKQFANGVVGAVVPGVVQNYCSYATAYDAQHGCNVKSDFPPPESSSNDDAQDTREQNLMKQLYWPYEFSAQYSDFIATAVNLYNDMIANAIVQLQMQRNNNKAQVAIDPNNGWIFAGAFFINIAKQNHQFSLPSSWQKDADVFTVFSESTFSLNTSIIARNVDFLTSAIEASNTMFNNAGQDFANHGTMPRTGNAKADAQLQRYNTLTQDIGNGIFQLFLSTISSKGGNHPALKAAFLGQTIYDWCMWMSLAFIALLVGFGLFGTTVLGTGLGVLASNFSFWVLGTFSALAVMLYVFATTLTVYIPMIPYIIFSLGVVNWLAATVETMLAAPIIAIGLIYPEGNHDIWGRAEQSLMLLLNIFLRPSLMIFGLITSLLMSYMAINYLNSTFLFAFQSVYSTSKTPLFMLLAFMALYISIFTTIMNKCFELIHVVPDKILRWVGGGHEQFGEAGAERIGQKLDHSAQQQQSLLKDPERSVRDASGKSHALVREQQDRNAISHRANPENQLGGGGRDGGGGVN